jgi:hypothetical protein
MSRIFKVVQSVKETLKLVLPYYYTFQRVTLCLSMRFMFGLYEAESRIPQFIEARLLRHYAPSIDQLHDLGSLCDLSLDPLIMS